MERAIIQTNDLRFSYTTAAGAAPWRQRRRAGASN